MNKVPRWVFRYVGNKTFDFSSEKKGKKGQYLAENDQKCIFWTKFGRFWAKNPNFYGSK